MLPTSEFTRVLAALRAVCQHSESCAFRSPSSMRTSRGHVDIACRWVCRTEPTAGADSPPHPARPRPRTRDGHGPESQDVEAREYRAPSPRPADRGQWPLRHFEGSKQADCRSLVRQRPPKRWGETVGMGCTQRVPGAWFDDTRIVNPHLSRLVVVGHDGCRWRPAAHTSNEHVGHATVGAEADQGSSWDWHTRSKPDRGAHFAAPHDADRNIRLDLESGRRHRQAGHREHRGGGHRHLVDVS